MSPLVDLGSLSNKEACELVFRGGTSRKLLYCDPSVEH
jgi:hypothetical protein